MVQDTPTPRSSAGQNSDQLLKMSSSIENAAYMFDADHPDILAANSNSNSASQSNSGGKSNARS